MTDDDPEAAVLHDLGRTLLRRRSDILESWRERSEAAGSSKQSQSLSRAEFEDHIPRVLNTLHARLTGAAADGNSGDTHAAGSEHGEHRWQQGYDMGDMNREWLHLQLVLDVEIDRFLDDRPDCPRGVIRRCREVVTEAIHDGVRGGIETFQRLLQLAADARYRDLRRVVEPAVPPDRLREGRGLGDEVREAAHDLRGSLSVLRGAVWLLTEERPEGDDRAEVLSLLANAADDLGGMLESLLDLARLEAGHESLDLSEFDAGAMLRNFCRNSRPLAEAEGLTLTARGPHPFPVVGDRLKLRRLTQNLTLNALKYTDTGGVEIGWGDLDGDRWVLRVSDTGPGLPDGTDGPLAAELESAAEPADTPAAVGRESPAVGDAGPPAHPGGAAAVRSHGEGIGLSIVKKLCELMNAGLELESERGVGTTFRVLIPRDPGAG